MIQRAAGPSCGRKDARDASAIPLSHGHFDHTGGLPSVLREVGRGQREVEVIAHEAVFDAHYFVPRRRPEAASAKPERPRCSGVPFSRAALESEGAVLRMIGGPLQISDSVFVTGEERIRAVIGGTRLGPAPKEQLEATIAVLRDLDVGRLGVTHCTGLKAAARLAQEFGDQSVFDDAGSVVELESPRLS